jgi:hypothetical protein
MKVSICAGGREVKIECSDTNVTYEQVADKALAVWQGTDGAKRPSDGPSSYGFGGERSPDGRGEYGLELGSGKPTPVQS